MERRRKTRRRAGVRFVAIVSCPLGARGELAVGMARQGRLSSSVRSKRSGYEEGRHEEARRDHLEGRVRS